jgi:hypothetical protein
MASKVKPAPVQTDPAVRKLQEELKQQGYYSGPIDGNMGKETADAVKRRDSLQISRNTTEAAKNDPIAQATRFATEFGPYAAGGGLGYALSRTMAHKFDTQDAAQKDQVSRLANTRGVNPAAADQELNRLEKARGVRTAKQFMAPGAFIGAGQLTQNVIAPKFEDEETRKYINLSGTMENAAGTTLAAKQLYDTAMRGNPNDPVDVAKIRSANMPSTPLSQALGGGAASPATPGLTAASAAPGAPQAAPSHAPGSLKHMRLQAKELGIKGVSRMNKSSLAEALAKSHAENSGKRIRGPKTGIVAPLAAGALAYDAVRSPSQAEDGTQSPGGSVGEGLAAGAGAAGLTAGGGYGMSKLAQALSPVANSAMAGTGMALGPMSVSDMTDYSPDEMAQGRNFLARNLPQALQFGAVSKAREMATVPAPGARDDASMMARDQAALEERMPMASASALELPQEPAQEAASPYPPQITWRLQYMIKNGAPPAAIANFLNQAVR